MNPFSFVLAILFIVIGIPVLSRTIITLVHGPKETRKEKKKQQTESEREMLEEIYYGLSDLGKRVQNLETILDSKEDENE